MSSSLYFIGIYFKNYYYDILNNQNHWEFRQNYFYFLLNCYKHFNLNN
jgi:hypothetical protein